MLKNNDSNDEGPEETGRLIDGVLEDLPACIRFCWDGYRACGDLRL